MIRGRRLAGLALAAISCSETTTRPPVDPIAIDECADLPALSLAATSSKTRTGSSITLRAEGGSGRYAYSLEPGGSGGELRDNRLITGPTPANDLVRVRDDCGQTAELTIEVAGSFNVAPVRASLRPETGFALEVSGQLGPARCSSRELGSGGQVSEDCQYQAGDREGLDVITVRDSGSGDELVVRYEVSTAAALRGAPGRLAIPAGGAITLHTLGGSDAATYSLERGPGMLAGALFSAADGDSGSALIRAHDRFTGEEAEILVQVLTELVHDDRPHGRLGDQASLVTGDFDRDGIEDVALGVPESDLGKPNGGAVFVFKGSTEGLPSEPNWTFTGETDTANLGAALAAGDFDGDGYPELIVSEPGADITVADSGAVLIYTWRDDEPELLRPALTGSGTGAGKFGSALAIADVNQDGSPDLLVASPNGDLAASNTLKERGVVDVFLIDGSVPDYASVRIGGSDLAADGSLIQTSSVRFGRAIAVGDFDGDGRVDLASLGTVNQSLGGSEALAKAQPAIALHFGRDASPPYAASPDLYITPHNPLDGAEGSYRLFAAPADDEGVQRLVIAVDKLDAPDLSSDASGKPANDAGGVYVYDLRDAAHGGQDGKPAQLGRDDAFARVYGDGAGISAARSVSFADLDRDGAVELILGAPNAARPMPTDANKNATAALTGKLLVYPFSKLARGDQLNQPSSVRWGSAAVDTFGVAVARWSPEAAGLLVFAGRATTERGDFTGRLDALLGDDPLAELPVDSAALPARLASQQRGAALHLARIDDKVQLLVGVPGFSGAGAKTDGDDLNAGRALILDAAKSSSRIVHEGAASRHDAGGYDAYGGRLIGTDVTTTDFDGDGRPDVVVAAPQLATPTAMNTDYAELDMRCVTPNAQGNGGALIFTTRPDGSFAPSFRVFAASDIAGCTPEGDASCKRKDIGRSGIAGGFDFDGDGKQDLMLTRANGLELFLGRAPAAASGDKPSMACDPVFSLPTLAQNVSAPAALGDLDADGCDEVGLRYADNNRSGVLILFGYAANGGRCGGHTQPAWLRIAGDAEVGLTNMQLGIATTRAGKLFGDDRDLLAVSANLYPFEGSRQPTVLLFHVGDLAALRPDSGERVISALDPALQHWPLVYRERAPGFGRALAGNVDLDGDGVVDLVVSAPGASLNGDGTGAVFAFRGQAGLGGRTDPWLSIAGDPRERASFGQDLSAIAATGTTPASVAIGAPLSYRTGTANGTAWLLQIAASAD